MKLVLYSEFDISSTGGGVRSVINTLANCLGKAFDVAVLNSSSSEIRGFRFWIDSRSIYDVFVNHTPFQTSLVNIIRHRIMSRKTICVIHSDPFYLIHHYNFHFSEISGSPRYRLRRCMVRLYVLLRYLYFCIMFNRIILLTESHVQKLSLIKFIGKKKLDWISNPLGLPIKIENDFEEHRRCVLFVGRLVPIKRVDKLIESWNLVCPMIPNFRFMIVGDGPELPRLKEKVDDLNLNNIIFVGNQSDVASFYDSASVILLCSAYEGTPQVIIEAQARGVIPIVCNTFSAAHSLIDDGYNGFLVDGVEPKLIAAKIAEVLSRDDLPKIRRNCVKSCDRFRADTVSNKWETLISQFA